MSFPPSKSKTYVNGEVLTHSDLNTSLSDAVNSNIPEDIDDYSVNATEMQTTTDPYPSAAVSLPTTLAGELERIRYILKQVTGKSQWYVDAAAIGSKGADVASAAALPVLTDGNFFDVTGTTAITSINTLGVGSVIRLQFDDALVITHHSTDLILPGGTNITTVAGDVATFVEYATGDWILVAYTGLAGRLTHDIPAGGFKFTGMGAGSAAGHSVRFEQLKYIQGPTQDTTAVATTTTSSTYQDTNLSASITPTSASNRIKISVSGGFQLASSTNIEAYITVFRGSTDLAATNQGFAVIRTSGALLRSPVSFVYVDSPATTSATTYTVKIKNSDNTTTASFPTGSLETCVLLLEEVV